jgi:hypothetical protein
MFKLELPSQELLSYFVFFDYTFLSFLIKRHNIVFAED